MFRRLLRLAHEQPELRAKVMPILREGAYYRRREPKYTGFLGAKHKAAVEKGYLDAGLVDPAYAAKNPKRFLNAVREHFPVGALAEKGVAFIRDPEDNGVTAAGSESAFVSYLQRNIAGVLAELLSEDAMYADESGNWEEFRRLSLIADAAEDATYKVVPVQGRTGKGYKVTMRPTLTQIREKHPR